MRLSATLRVREGGMERLREIAARHGALSRSGIRAGEASVSELLDKIIGGELVIVERGERTMEQTAVSIRQTTEPLFSLYSRQDKPQGTYLQLDLRDGELWADTNSEIGNGVPMAVFHGLVRRYRLAGPMHTGTVNELMGKIAPLAQRVLGGSEVVWDGNNHVARLTEDAQQAEYEIGEELDCWEPDYNWADAVDWLYETRDQITARLAAGEPLAALAQELDGDGSEGDPVLVGLTQYLEQLQADN